MKKILILTILFAVAGCLKAQNLFGLDSLVIKLTVMNDDENWTYTFSFSEKGIRVQGSDYSIGCYILHDDVYNYYEMREKRFLLYHSGLMAHDSSENYSYEVFRLTRSIIELEQADWGGWMTLDSDRDTLGYFLLYKDGSKIGEYNFNFENPCIRTQAFSDLIGILRQIKKKRCPLPNNG